MGEGGRMLCAAMQAGASGGGISVEDDRAGRPARSCRCLRFGGGQSERRSSKLRRPKKIWQASDLDPEDSKWAGRSPRTDPVALTSWRVSVGQSIARATGITLPQGLTETSASSQGLLPPPRRLAATAGG